MKIQKKKKNAAHKSSRKFDEEQLLYRTFFWKIDNGGVIDEKPVLTPFNPQLWI